MTASDADGIESKYGKLTYSKIGDVPFSVNRNTGQLSVSGKLDRERKDKYTFKIQAEDGGGKKATVNVEITILDVNDSTPKFPLTSYSVKLAEDAELGTNVFKIQDSKVHLRLVRIKLKMVFKYLLKFDSKICKQQHTNFY